MTTTIAKKPKTAPQRKLDGSPRTAIMETPAVTLDQLAREMKMAPRDARMLLRLAAKKTNLYPSLGKEHIARQPWQWVPGSKALEEARRALSTPQEA